VDQHVGHLEAIALDRARTFAPIRNARCVTEVINLFIRQQIAQGLDHSESADSGIEYSDWTRCLHAPQRDGAVTGPQGDCVAVARAKKQPPHAWASREKDLSLCNQPAHPYDTAEDLNKSVILWRSKELLFI